MPKTFEDWLYTPGRRWEGSPSYHDMRECWHAATAAERERCLDWVMAYRRDCGCADLIADAIRAGGKEPKP